MGLGGFELRGAVKIRARFVFSFGQRPPPPVRATGQRIIVLISRDEINCQFAPHDQLFEISLFGGFRRIGFLYGQCDGYGRDVAEMEIRRHAARRV